MAEPFALDINPDIRQAQTPPGRLYEDPQVFARVRERIFASSWQWIGDIERARVPDQVWPFTLLEGCLNEPLLLTRDARDQLHCISNVCTHRGALVCEHPGHERSLRCRYHGRQFDLDGRFKHMPEFAGVEGFPSPADDLAAVPLKNWGPHLFASLAPSVTFPDWIGPMQRRMAWLPLNEFTYDAARSRDYLVKANWALYCENYLEGFHVPFVHASLADKLDFARYRTELFDYSSLQLGVAGSGEGCFDQPAGSPDHGQRIAAYYFWLFPNLMFNFYPWGLSINVVRPLGVELTRVSFLAYVWDRSRLDQGAGAGLDRVEREDEAVVESVQRGLKSRIYDRGRYSPTQETGTHHFHCLLARALAD